jgi:glycosyltransferase involved in cell wall biosynthesis
MMMADADVYYQRTRDSVTGIVAAFCRWHRKRFIFAVAHDYNCMAHPPFPLARHAHALYCYGLRRADLIVAQTATQRRLLFENFGLESIVIPNSVPDGSDGADAATSGQNKRLLWIGAFTPVKRLELLLDVAEQLKNRQFDIVGDGDTGSEYVRDLRSRAKAMANVTLHGVVPHWQVDQFYHSASALICTSCSEGFPNVFLEAWSHGVPLVSTFDPDNVVSERGLGVVAKDTGELAAGIEALLSSESYWQDVSQRTTRYYRENHTVNTTVGRLERALLDVTRISG